MKYHIILSACSISLWVIDCALPDTTHEILRQLYIYHQNAHKGLPSPQTTYYSGAQTIPGVQIRSIIPRDDQDYVELKITINNGQSSDLQKALLKIAHKKIAQRVLPNIDEEQEVSPCGKFAELFFSCITPERTNRRKTDFLVMHQIIEVDDYTTLRVPQGENDTFELVIAIKKHLLDGYEIEESARDPLAMRAITKSPKNINLAATFQAEPDEPDYVMV